MIGNITQSEFEERLQAGKLVLTLVGMSNVGKSYWAERLAKECGFTHISCDDLIETQLGDELKMLGYRGIADVAKWLGQPYDEQFASNQQKFLNVETEIVLSLTRRLKADHLKGNIIIDTSGSVAHINQLVQKELERYTTVVYLEATHDMQDEMFRLYLSEPKPVVWGDLYQPEPGETSQQTLARCYPKLLAYRSQHYAAMSHITIHRRSSLKMVNATDFMARVQNSL